MATEEAARVIGSCDKTKVCFKQRLAGPGIKSWNLYDAKRKSGKTTDTIDLRRDPSRIYRDSF